MTKRTYQYRKWLRHLKDIQFKIDPVDEECFEGLIPTITQKGSFDFLYDPELGMPKTESFNFASFEIKYSIIPAMEHLESKDSFCLMIPKDIERYPDGTPRRYFGDRYEMFTWDEIEKEYRHMTKYGPICGEWSDRGITCDWDTDKHIFEKYLKKEPEETFMGIIPYLRAKVKGERVSEFQDRCWRYGTGLNKTKK